MEFFALVLANVIRIESPFIIAKKVYAVSLKSEKNSLSFQKIESARRQYPMKMGAIPAMTLMFIGIAT